MADNVIPTTQSGKLLGFVIVAGLFYLAGQYIASAPQRASQEQEAERQITVSGRGEVHSRPDIAYLTLGVNTGVRPSAEEALGHLSDRFTAVVTAVKGAGVAEDDITTTNVSINPVYDYVEGRQILRGFEAQESIRVKIRELNRIGEVLTRSTIEGVNQAGGISFAIDDAEALQQEAQEQAIADAQEKAEQLARALQVRLGSVKSFSSSPSPQDPPILYERAALEAAGSAAALPVPPGSQDIVAQVTITYELR
ncbi:MAG: SIMPL domain-containing protein [Candidatus Andersenbacteria bacterium]